MGFPVGTDSTPVLAGYCMKVLFDTLTTTKKIFFKGSKERYLIWTKQNMRIFGVIPFIKLQNNT